MVASRIIPSALVVIAIMLLCGVSPAQAPTTNSPITTAQIPYDFWIEVRTSSVPGRQLRAPPKYGMRTDDRRFAPSAASCLSGMLCTLGRKRTRAGSYFELTRSRERLRPLGW
jgi:hypothetical protein